MGSSSVFSPLDEALKRQKRLCPGHHNQEEDPSRLVQRIHLSYAELVWAAEFGAQVVWLLKDLGCEAQLHSNLFQGGLFHLKIPQ